MIGAVILLAGFSQPMCDVDYFMSKLARQLAGNGLFVAQVDPRGHGDSGCELANVDLDTLREDITIINQYSS
jgi:alpha-beta hydrolase superfamily lysophospholipase